MNQIEAAQNVTTYQRQPLWVAVKNALKSEASLYVGVRQAYPKVTPCQNP